MRARESCRPSALPLKVGRKPKLTSNKVFEVVRGGSWGNCRSERGGWRREAVNYSCLMPSYRVGCSRLGPVTARGCEADLAWISLENHLWVGRETQGLSLHSLWVLRPGTHCHLHPGSFNFRAGSKMWAVGNLSPTSVLDASGWWGFGFGNCCSFVGGR